MVDKNQIIEQIIEELNFRSREGYPLLKKSSHIELLSEILTELGLSSIKHELIENLLIEDEEEPLDDREKERAKKMGLVWKGKGYGKEEDDFISYKNDGGKLVAVDKDGEAAEKEKDAFSGKAGDDFKQQLPKDDPAYKSNKVSKSSEQQTISTKNKKSLDTFIEKGFSNSAGAPGSAGSMLNEIFSSIGATDTLNSGESFDFYKVLDNSINKLKGSGLGKDNQSKNLPTGVKKSEAQPIAEKYGVPIGEAGKIMISTRAAESKHNHVLKNIIQKSNIDNSEFEPFFGDKEGMQAQEDMINSVEGKVLLGNTEVTKEEAIKIIRSGGGGENPTNAGIFITNKDTGDVYMTFYSDKDNVSAIVAQSSLKAEFKLKKSEVDNLVKKGNLSE
jgi:hypothetical protein